jgi:hypothetical protein
MSLSTLLFFPGYGFSLNSVNSKIVGVHFMCMFNICELNGVNVEEISINYGNIMYDTPYLTLHDWHWISHTVQHQDDGYWRSRLCQQKTTGGSGRSSFM